MSSSLNGKQEKTFATISIKDKAEMELKKWVEEELDKGKQVSALEMLAKYDEIYGKILRESK